jgi:hypothetical protein
MEHKFKIGDQFRHYDARSIFQIVDIIEGTKDYYGPWLGDPYATVNDCYIVKEVYEDSKLSKHIFYTSFRSEYNMNLISKFCPTVQPEVSKCPRCSGGLVRVESESIFGTKYQGQKCNACGYCE